MKSHLLTGKGHPRSESIVQLNLDGTFVKEWESLNLVETLTERKWKRAHISRCIKDRRRAYGFYWVKKEDYDNKS